MCKQGSHSALKTLAALSAIFGCITGLATIYLGQCKYGKFASMAEATGYKYTMMSLAVIVVGILTVSVAFLGFAVLFFMGYNIIMGYFYMVLFTFMVQAVFGGFTLIDGQEYCNIKDDISKSMTNYVTKSRSRAAMNQMESRLHCCGVNGAFDYHPNYTAVLSKGSQDSLPISCCKEYSYCHLNDQNHWTKGCLNEASTFTFNTQHEMGTLLVCFSTVSAMSAAIVYVHAMNIGRYQFYI